MASKKKTAKRRKSGPSGANKQIGINFRELEPGQFEVCRRAARLSGLSLTSWMRERCLIAARAELLAAGEKP